MPSCHWRRRTAPKVIDRASPDADLEVIAQKAYELAEGSIISSCPVRTGRRW